MDTPSSRRHKDIVDHFSRVAQRAYPFHGGIRLAISDALESWAYRVEGELEDGERLPAKQPPRRLVRREPNDGRALLLSLFAFLVLVVVALEVAKRII